MHRRLGSALAAAALGGALLAPNASAQDSLAPPGAARDWLPDDIWVMSHWLPYDIRRLYALLDTDQEAIRAWFGGAEHQVVPPLAGMAEQQGLTVSQTVRTLMRESWRGTKLPRKRRRELAARTRRTLTQGHLMQHMMFHTFHERALVHHARDIYGTDQARVGELLREGMTLLEIGAMYGRSSEQVHEAATRVLRRNQRRGARRRQTPRSEARREARLQVALLHDYLGMHHGEHEH